MRRILFAFLLISCTGSISAQFVYKIKADSVKITNDSCNAELILENSTRAVKGFLYNYGNGRTRFQKGVVKIGTGDSLYLIGGDTLNLANGGGFNAWRLNGNAGTNASTNFLGTTDDAAVTIRSNNVPRMTISRYGGNTAVGIGTTTPTATLHIYGENPSLYVQGDENSYYSTIGLSSVIGSGSISNYGIRALGGINLVTATAHGRVNIGATPTGILSTSEDSTMITHTVLSAQRQVADIFHVSSNISNTPGEATEKKRLSVKADGEVLVGDFGDQGTYNLQVSGDTWTDGKIYAQGSGSFGQDVRVGWLDDGATGTTGSIYINGPGKLMGTPLIKIEDFTYGGTAGAIDIASNSQYNYSSTPGGGSGLRFIKTAANGGGFPNYGAVYVEHVVNNSSNLENLYSNFAVTKVGGGSGVGYFAKATVLPGGSGTAYSFYADSGYAYFREKVGLNAPAPQYLLDVNGDARISSLPFVANRDTVLTYDAATKQLKATLPIVAGTLIGVRVLTSGTSYTPTTGTKSISVQMIAGGGGGGGVTGINSNVGAAGGGGAGGYLVSYITGIGAGPYTYAIGAAGTAGSNTGGTGGDGGNTTLTIGATTYTANGGSGGVGQTSGSTVAIVLGGNGGAISSNGDVNSAGQPGERGMRLSDSVGASGSGGSSIFGAGGNARNTAGAGNAGIAYGAGGSGALSTTSTAQTGGVGSAGVIVIYEYK